MSWLSEIPRSLSGQAFLTHVEDTLYRRCEGQPRRAARDDPHWTRRARAIINQAGAEWRLQEIPAPLYHLSANASGRGAINGQPAGATGPVSSACGIAGRTDGARMVGNREGVGGAAYASPPAQVSAAPAGRRGGQSDNAAHPTKPGWTDDPEFWAPLMSASEATPGGASVHGATSYSFAATANKLKAQDHAA